MSVTTENPYTEMMQGDLEPPLEITLLDGSPPAPKNVSTAVSVTLRIWRGNAILREVSVTPPDDGKVTYNWQSGDTSVPGTLEANVDVEVTAGRHQTYPRSGAIQIVVNPRPDVTI